MKWPTPLYIGFAVMLTMNATFIYMAFSGADDVVPEYLDESNR